MSGHSKWSTIKRKKEATDAKRGQIFTKISRELTVAAKEGGPDPEANVRLRLAVQKAKSVNMPAENIKRAIERSATDSSASNFEEIVYEGYGPGGVAVMVEALTDNRNRTVSEVRNIFNRGGGRMGESGSVAWMFEPRGLVAVELSDGRQPDEVVLAAIEAGAADVDDPAEDGVVEVYTELADLKAVEESLTSQGLAVTSAEKIYWPKTTVQPDSGDAEALVKLMEKLEDLDDVQGVYSNAELDASVAANAGV